MDNLPQLANDPERFAWIRHHLYVPAVCDILDSLGYRDQAMHQRLRPLDPANCTIVGRARILCWMETDYVVQRDPYGLEIEALDSLKLACCKVAVDACFLSSLTASAIATRPCINGYALSIQPTAQSLAARELFAGWRRTTWSRVILMVWRLRRWTVSSWHAAKLRLTHVFSFLSDFLRWFGQGLLDPPFG